MKKHIYTVIPGDAGITLGAFLAHRMDLATDQAARWVVGGSAYVDGRRELKPGLRLRAGQKLVVRQPEGEDQASVAVPLVIAHAEAALAVVNKPAGLPCGATRRGGGVTLEQLVAQELGPSARLLHRLDRVTSGLVLVSRRKGGGRTMLARQVANHLATRRYLALVAGEPPSQRTLDSPLAMEHGLARPSSDPRARPAETRIRTLQASGGRALVQATPRTGRTHQIRAHLSHAGWPILGDVRYGGAAAGRVCLHAHALGFKHPGGQWVEVHAPMPADMREEM